MNLSTPSVVHTLLVLQLACLAVKIFFVVKLNNLRQKSSNQFLWFLLLTALALNAVGDLSWIANLFLDIYKRYGPAMVGTYTTTARLAWISYAAEYFCLSLFIEGLTQEGDVTLKRSHSILGSVVLMTVTCWIYQIIFGGPRFSGYDDTLSHITILLAPLTVIPSVVSYLYRIQTPHFPKLLAQQLSIFIKFLLLPRLFVDLVVNDPLKILPTWYAPYHSLTATISSWIFVYTIYFSSRKMLGMRFLNVQDQVTGHERFNFIQDIKSVLRELGQVVSLQELDTIIKGFYEKSFNIPREKTSLVVCSNDQTVDDNEFLAIIQPYLQENFIRAMPLLVRDEIEFSCFYEPTEHLTRALTFLNHVQADIAIPIYDKKKIIGCVLVMRNATPGRLYSTMEYDEMLVFNSYLGALINLLKHRNIESLVQQEKELKEELYLKHQEIRHYKETIRGCLAKHYTDSSQVAHNARILKDPTNWDSILFLETTQSGKLINKVIPGTGTQILDFKVNLLKAALSNKAVLLELPEEDLLPTAELLHHISLREHFEVIDCQSPELNLEYALKLFGINPLYDKTQAVGLLEKLDAQGTVLIKNIERLSLATQEMIAHTLHTGIFYPLKSDRKCVNNARIMCSSTTILSKAVAQGTFSQRLYNELGKTSASLPSLITLDTTELETLTQGFAERITTDSYEAVGLELSSKERASLIEQRPVSLQEYRSRVYNMLLKKAKKQAINPEQALDGAYVEYSPELYQIAKLGKQALKDRQIMIFLWNKFKNQTKIAKILNVNRSSVNRRCKEFNLI